MYRSQVLFTCVALCAALSFSNSVAEAQGRYTRDNVKVKVKVRQTERTRGLAAPNKNAKSEIKPEVSSDVILDIEGKVKFIRKAEIEGYKDLIKITDEDDPEMPKLLFELAELYAAQQRYWRFRAFEMYTKVEEAQRKKQRKKARELKKKQDGYFKAEKAYLTESAKTYAKVANNPKFKNYPKMPQVLFSYAFTLQTAKRMDLARKVFLQLLKEYPESKYVPQAYLAFADHAFETGDLDTAEKFYDRVLKFPKARIYPYAMYKRSWVYLNQKRFKASLKSFENVVQLTKKGKRNKELNKAAKKDLVRPYAEIGKAQRAYQFFQRVDSGYAFQMLKILAAFYLDQGKAPEAIYSHRELIGLRPKDPEVCSWQYNVVSAMITVGGKDKQVDEITKLVKLYSKYKEVGVLKGEKLRECKEDAALTSSEMAKIWHSESAKTLNVETLAYAEKLYKLYIKYFPNEKDVGEIEYYLAELLWQRGEGTENRRVAAEIWERAGVAFTDVVKRNKVSPKLRKEAAKAAVLAMKNALDVDPRTDVKLKADAALTEDPDTLPPPKKIGEAEQRMLDAFDVYLKYIKDPNDDERIVMKFLKARIYWRHHQLDKSNPLFAEIVDKHPDYDQAQSAAVILINSYIRQGNNQEVTRWVKKLLKRKKWLADKEELKAELLVLEAQGEVLVADGYRKEGKHFECGEAYLKIYNANPNGSDADTNLYNAGVCYEEAKSIGLALQAFGKLNERFPKSARTKKALYRMGWNYGVVGYYKQAAEKFEVFAKKYAGEKEAPDAIANAVLYRKGIGDDDQAIKDTELFVKLFRRKMKDKTAEAFFSMASIYEKRNDWKKAVSHYNRYVKEFGASGGRDRLVMAHAKAGELLWKQSCRVKLEDGSCVTVKRERATRRRRKARRSGNNLPKQCGPASKIKLTVQKRDKKLVGQARAHFKKAQAEFRKFKANSLPSKNRQARAAQAVYWYASARFHSNELEYEQFLDSKFPTGLDFDKRNKRKAAQSDKKFKKWLAAKTKQGKKLIDAYEAVRNIKGGGFAWRIAGAARIGQISQNFADALYTAEVPRDVRTGKYAEDGWNAYCDALTTAAAPLEAQSIAGYSYCLDMSTKLNWFNDWSRMCEKELGQIDPTKFPTASEVHASASGVAPVTDTQGLLTEIN